MYVSIAITRSPKVRLRYSDSNTLISNTPFLQEGLHPPDEGLTAYRVSGSSDLV